MTTTGPPVPPAPTRPPRRLKPPIRRNARNVTFFLAAGIAIVVVAISGAVLLTINRSAYQAGHQPTPRAAAEAYLYAVLQDREADSAAKYTCTDAAQRKTNTVIKSITDWTSRARGNDIAYTWTVQKTTKHGTDQATVTANVRTTVTADGSISVQPNQTWTLQMRDRGGWKVAELQLPPS